MLYKYTSTLKIVYIDLWLLEENKNYVTSLLSGQQIKYKIKYKAITDITDFMENSNFFFVEWRYLKFAMAKTSLFNTLFSFYRDAKRKKDDKQ